MSRHPHRYKVPYEGQIIPCHTGRESGPTFLFAASNSIAKLTELIDLGPMMIC